MRRTLPQLISLLLFIATSLIMLLQTNTPVLAQSGQTTSRWDEWDVVPGRLIVKYKPSRSAQLRQKTANLAVGSLQLTPLEQPVQQSFEHLVGVNRVFRSILPDTFVGEFDIANRDSILRALASDSDVLYYEPDRKRVAHFDWGTSTPNDTQRSKLWGMDRIRASYAWGHQSTTRAVVRVAVMEDDRYDSSHRDLVGQNSSVQNHPGSVGDHATHVAGIIAATGNNNLDVVGVANVELVALDIGSIGSEFAQRISWAVNNQVRVINMSWKWCGDKSCTPCLNPSSSQTEQDAINRATGSIVFIASAGNDNCNLDSSGRAQIPVSYNGVIGVSAIDSSDNRASFSNFGAYVDLAAPGVGIRSTVQSPLFYADMDGTSMAAPHVAGTAAAVLAIRSSYHILSIPRLLQLTAEDIGVAGRDDNFGQGVVRVDRAIAAIADTYAEAGGQCWSAFTPGTLDRPYCDLDFAINSAPIGGTVGIVRGSVYSGPRVLTKPLTLTSVGGPVTLGR